MTRKPYPSDLTDKQWEELAPLLPAAKPGGRHRSVDLREVINGTLYVLRSGCAWRMMPHDLPPWGTVSWYFRQWRLDGSWERIHDALRPKVREAEGREPTPSAAIMDSQSVKTTEKGGLVDTMQARRSEPQAPYRRRHFGIAFGRCRRCCEYPGTRRGRRPVGAKLVGRFPRLQLIWADGGYAGQLVEWAYAFGGWLLEIVKRPPDIHHFEVLPRRWVVERTFAWLGRCRRLSKDYEALPQTSEAWVQIAMIHLMLRRLKPT